MKLEEAIFAKIAPWDWLAFDTPDVVVFYDRYPVTDGHMLFVPKDDSEECISKALALAYSHGAALVKSKNCNGFNVGLNSGISAGQTVMYPHIHLIPRRTGDMPDPTGGVRHVIPERGNYKKGKVDENSSTVG
jgi:diadenosine tetraphosphate (Ap4A) HIT family hydrolase